MRKVVELARALCTEPRLMLLDEPSSGLNVEETDDMAFWIQDIRNLLGITVLMVEHDMSLVSRRVRPRDGAELRSRRSPPGRLPRCRAIRKSSPPISGVSASTDAEPILKVSNVESYYGPIMAIRGV